MLNGQHECARATAFVFFLVCSQLLQPQEFVSKGRRISGLNVSLINNIDTDVFWIDENAFFTLRNAMNSSSELSTVSLRVGMDTYKLCLQCIYTHAHASVHTRMHAIYMHMQYVYFE